ncbi:MAG: adenylosuccinate lyase [Geminicoccaceae bacterium]|nr:MAG: adenylosuccinate lyase [Geminicoccaceae bacterium]
MIPRYSRPAMAGLFEPAAKLEIWLDVELAVAEAMAQLDLLPRQPIAVLRQRADAERRRLIDPVRVEEIERTTRHDVIAFLTHVEAVVGEEARFLHLGMTSSDLLDTTLAIQLTQASDLLLADVDAVLEVLRRRAHEQKDTVCIGRSHGIHAEPTTFGVKLAGHFAEFERCRRRLEVARAEIATCAMSGAVGTFANIDPRVEAMVAARFGLVPEPVSTQVIPRDRHAAFVCALAVTAAAIERLAVEVRHLQRTEVGEVEEAFGKGQKGSSAMPHKRNPVLSENLTGLSRLIRAQVAPSLENVSLWHERDISHSSVERIALPEACILLDFALARLADMMAGLVVFADRMRENLERTHGLVHSQRVLLALTAAGLPRQEAYEVVQRQAMRAWSERQPLQGLLAEDATVQQHLGPGALAALFDLGYHTAQVGLIFGRVFGGGSTSA